MTAAGATVRQPALGTLSALYGLLLRSQVSVRRLLGVGGLGALALVLGLFARSNPLERQAAVDVVSSYGLALLVPLATLWLGTSVVGDLVEDRLLAYLWLKPVPRWQLPAAAVLATATVVLPLAALPLGASALVAGAPEVAPPAVLASSLATVAYSALFVAAGLWFRRAVWWGLAFVLLWENGVAYAAEGSARFTVAGWASSILGLVSDVDLPLDAGSPAAAFIVLPAIAVFAWLVATWRYARVDID